MDPLRYFGEKKVRDAHIADLTEALKKCEQQHAMGDYPVTPTLDELKAAIEALKSSSSSKRSGLALDKSVLFGLRAIIRAKFRPVLPLKWDEKSGNHLPFPTHVSSLGFMEEGDRKWGELLAEALKAPVAGRKYPLEEIFRQVARVEHYTGDALGTAWPLHIETGMIWITNRHVLAKEGNPWYRRTSENVWEPTDSDSPGLLNCNAVGQYPKDVPVNQRPRPFKVADVAPRSTYDIAALTVSLPHISGLDIVWDPDEIDDGKDPTEALRNRIVLAIGHPVDPKEQSAANVNTVFHWGKITEKHLMPGRLLARPWGNHEGLDVLLHDCSTISGTSGSCIIDLGPPGTNYANTSSLPRTFGKVIGVHFFGIENHENRAVPSWKLTDLF